MLDQRRAIQIYLENKDRFKGMTQSDAINAIRRSGGLPDAAEAAPVPAAPPVTTAIPVPQAAPTPEVPPEPKAPQAMNPYESALAAYNLANPEAPPAAPTAKKAPVDYAAMARKAATERQRAGLEENVEIARTSKVDPEIQDLIKKRGERYDEQLGNIDKDRKQATWMAVAQAGMKMAQSQSPYFMQALASGMEAGINGYSEAKAKAAEKKARLQDAKEDLVIRSKELRDEAIAKAIGARLAAKQGAAADAQLEKETLAGIIGQETADDVIAAAALGNDLTRANIANINSTISERAAAGRRAERAARNGDGGGINMKNAGQFVNSLISENKTFAAILENPLASKAEKDQARAGMNSNKKQIDYLRSLQGQKFGMSSGFKILGPA